MVGFTFQPSTDVRDLGAGALVPMIRQELSSLLQALEAAELRQWEASPVPRPREDAGRKAPGGVSDPTADVVADTRRMRVSSEAGTSQRLLAGVYERIVAQRERLEGAMARYDGCDL